MHIVSPCTGSAPAMKLSYTKGYTINRSHTIKQLAHSTSNSSHTANYANDS